MRLYVCMIARAHCCCCYCCAAAATAAVYAHVYIYEFHTHAFTNILTYQMLHVQTFFGNVCDNGDAIDFLIIFFEKFDNEFNQFYF